MDGPRLSRSSPSGRDSLMEKVAPHSRQTPARSTRRRPGGLWFEFCRHGIQYYAAGGWSELMGENGGFAHHCLLFLIAGSHRPTENRHTYQCD